MIEMFALKLCIAYEQLTTNIVRLMIREHAEPSAVLSDSDKHYVVVNVLEPLSKELDQLELDELSNKAKVINGRLVQQGYRWTVERLLDALEGLKRELVPALHKRRFAYFPPPNDKFFDRADLFGEKVGKKIPASRQDIKEAGTCLAAGLYTACVFHLMRVAEHGLRKLARKFHVVLVHKGHRSPMEEEGWGKIILALKDKIEEAHRVTSKPKKRERLRFYSDLTDHVLFMRDLWRNDVSHVRGRYNEEEAKMAWSRVERFMQLLADAK
jgi:hypothetical protein